MDTPSTILRSLQIIKGSQHLYAIKRIGPPRPGHLLLVKTASQEHEIITELITQWVLRGTFYLIAGGEWLPAHGDLRYSVYRYTTVIEETLNNLILARPFTCFQLLDLLMEAGRHNKPEKGKDQDQVISQEAEQLPCRVAPARVEQGMDEVERVPEKDTAKNDG